MTKSDKVLVIVLRYFVGIGGLFALVPVFMPLSWMVATHRWLGLGEMPTAPVVEYLARSLSAFYAFFGGLCLVVAADLERYRPLIRFLGVAFVLFGIVFTGVDLSAGMPWWWTAIEGPPGSAFWGVDVLARPFGSLETRTAMSHSLCETCTSMREIVTPKGSRFLLCQLSQTNPDFPKYPPQPVVRCDGYKKKKEGEPR